MVRFGSPRWGQPSSGRVLRELIDEVMADIAGLCGQAYVERFASVPT